MSAQKEVRTMLALLQKLRAKMTRSSKRGPVRPGPPKLLRVLGCLVVIGLLCLLELNRHIIFLPGFCILFPRLPLLFVFLLLVLIITDGTDR